MIHSFEIPRRRNRLKWFIRQRSALLVLDCAFVTHKGLIIFTRPINTIQDAGNMVSWWRKLINKVVDTATHTEAHHRATLVNLAHGFATPVLVDEILTVCQRVNDDRA